jgi:hypothetical protein
MNSSALRAGLRFALILAAGVFAASVADAADVSSGTGLRHSGQIHTHRGHHAKTKTTPNTTQDQNAAQGNGTAPAR